MNPLTKNTLELPPFNEWVKHHIAGGVPKPVAKKRFKEYKRAEIWSNELYLVILHRNYRGDLNPQKIYNFTWMSLKRHDGQQIFEWEHVQRIKNQLLGADAEMVQLFPSELRLVNMVNQYHFFSTGKPFEFGFRRREVNPPKF